MTAPGHTTGSDRDATSVVAVSCRGLRYRFGDHMAVDGIDLDVARARSSGSSAQMGTVQWYEYCL